MADAATAQGCMGRYGLMHDAPVKDVKLGCAAGTIGTRDVLTLVVEVRERVPYMPQLQGVS